MSMKPLYLRPTGVLTYWNCSYAYYLQYVLRIKSVAVAHALAFGKAVHQGVLPYVVAHAEGETVDTESLFNKAWKEQLDNNIISFNSLDSDALTGIGRALARQFPRYWNDSGLKAVIANGKALVENRLRWDIGNRIILSGEPDIVATRINDPLQKLVVPDAKTPKTKAFASFVKLSDQLTAYNFLVYANRDKLGVTGREIGEVGFLEGLKQKKNPHWHQPQFAAARSQEVMGEYLNKLHLTAGLIRLGRFQKQPGMAHNSPCSTCSLLNLCTKRDATGLHSELGDVVKLVRAPINEGLQIAEEHKDYRRAA